MQQERQEPGLNQTYPLDLFAADYWPELAPVAKGYLGLTARAETPSLYRGDGRGGFKNVARDVGLTRVTLTMGSNFGDVDLWGADLAAQLLVSPELSLKGTFSWVSEECFDLNEDGDCSDGVDIALNAPTTKGSFTAHYGNAAAGFTAEGRVRFVGDFPMNSGVYVGDMEGYTVVDANLGYRLPMVPGATITLTATNLLNEVHREFIGAPEIGRLVLARLSLQL